MFIVFLNHYYPSEIQSSQTFVIVIGHIMFVVFAPCYYNEKNNA